MTRSVSSIALLAALATVTACGGDSARTPEPTPPATTPDGTVYDLTRSTSDTGLYVPRVSRVNVLELSLRPSHGGPLYMHHPLELRARLEIEGEPLKASAWYGLQSPSGAHCTVGQIAVDHMGDAYTYAENASRALASEVVREPSLWDCSTERGICTNEGEQCLGFRMQALTNFDDAGNAVATDSADGTKVSWWCATPQWASQQIAGIRALTPADLAGAQTIEHPIGAEAVLPEECAALVGAPDVSAWISFDPVKATAFEARPQVELPTGMDRTTDDGEMAYENEFAHRQQLPGSVPEGTSVLSDLGLDVDMMQLQIGSPVVELTPYDHPAGDFSVSTEFRIDGNPTEAQQAAMGSAHFDVGFTLEPLGAARESCEVPANPPANQLAPVPLTIIDSEGNNVVAEVNSEVIPEAKEGVDHAASIELHIPSALRARLHDGDLRCWDQFRLRSCLTSSVSEVSGDHLGADNNCQDLTLTLLRKAPPPEGSEVPPAAPMPDLSANGEAFSDKIPAGQYGRGQATKRPEGAPPGIEEASGASGGMQSLPDPTELFNKSKCDAQLLKDYASAISAYENAGERPRVSSIYLAAPLQTYLDNEVAKKFSPANRLTVDACFYACKDKKGNDTLACINSSPQCIVKPADTSPQAYDGGFPYPLRELVTPLWLYQCIAACEEPNCGLNGYGESQILSAPECKTYLSSTYPVPNRNQTVNTVVNWRQQFASAKQDPVEATEKRFVEDCPAFVNGSAGLEVNNDPARATELLQRIRSTATDPNLQNETILRYSIGTKCLSFFRTAQRYKLENSVVVPVAEDNEFARTYVSKMINQVNLNGKAGALWNKVQSQCTIPRNNNGLIEGRFLPDLYKVYSAQALGLKGTVEGGVLTDYTFNPSTGAFSLLVGGQGRVYIQGDPKHDFLSGFSIEDVLKAWALGYINSDIVSSNASLGFHVLTKDIWKVGAAFPESGEFELPEGPSISKEKQKCKKLRKPPIPISLELCASIGGKLALNVGAKIGRNDIDENNGDRPGISGTVTPTASIISSGSVAIDFILGKAGLRVTLDPTFSVGVPITVGTTWNLAYVPTPRALKWDLKPFVRGDLEMHAVGGNLVGFYKVIFGLKGEYEFFKWDPIKLASYNLFYQSWTVNGTVPLAFF